jgi:hypothetical protein
MDSQSFKVPFITPEQVWAKADYVRSISWPSNKVPIEIEEVLWYFKLQIDPIASLKGEGDVDALLTGDLTRIIVDMDEYMNDRMLNRMRFSIAHELGHFILHKNIYQSIKHTSIQEWIKFVQCIPEDQYAYIEQQAYEFAGRLLVPTDRLKQELHQAYKKAKKAGFIDWEKSGDAAREYIASSICRVFGVSSAVIEKRIIREQHKLG